MYKYTPKKEIAKRLSRDYWRTRGEYARKLLAGISTDGYVIAMFLFHYRDVEFWSRRKRQYVPVMGWLMPVRKLFNEEFIEEGYGEKDTGSGATVA